VLHCEDLICERDNKITYPALPYEASVIRDYFVYLLTGHTSRDAIRPNLDARYSISSCTYVSFVAWDLRRSVYIHQETPVAIATAQ